MLCGIVADRFAGRRLRRSASTPRSRTLRLRPRPRRRRPSRAWASSRSRLIPFSVEKAKKALDKAVKKEYKVLLTDITGFCAPNQLTALMGSSGAGKTTLMDVIAGRKTAGVMTGEIKVGGRPKDPATFSKLCGYAEQNDLHM